MVKDFPLEFIHKSANKFAQAALCAGDQGKYWEMRDRLFTNQKDLKPENLPDYALRLGLNEDAFTTCLETEKYAAHINNEKNNARKAGIAGPTLFLLGFLDADGTVKAVRIIRGTHPYAVFKQAIDALLTSIK